MTASGDYDLPLHRLRGLPAGRGIKHFGYTRVGGPGSGDSGYLPGLAPPRLTSPSTRLQAYSLWEILTFMLNSLLFILIGLQLPTILEGISEDYSPTTLTLYAAAVCLAVIVARFVWIFPATYLPRRASPRLRERDPSPPWQNVAVRLLGDAGGGLPGRSARSSRRVSRPRPRPLSHLLRHLRHPRGPGSDVAAIDPVARHPRRRGLRERGNQGPPPGGGGGSRADRRAGGGGLGLRRHRGEDARHVRLPTTPLRYPPRQRYRQTCRGLCRGPRWRP